MNIPSGLEVSTEWNHERRMRFVTENRWNKGET